MEDKLINLEDMRSLFRKRLWIIIVVTALTTVLGIYKTRQMAPTYTCSMKFLVSTSDKILDNYSENEIEAYSKFMATFNEIMKVGDFLDDTLKKNKIDKTSLEVASSLSFSSSENTPIVNIYYSSYTDKQMEETLNAVCDELIDKVKEIMPGTNPTVLSEARVSTIYPNKTKLLMIAFAAGIIVSIGLILVLDYLDSRIMSKKQLEKVIPVAVLGSIPMSEREFRKENKNVYNEKNAQVTVSGGL